MASPRTTDSLDLPDAKWRKLFRRRLRAWYAREARDLPWRRIADPYSIWVSETMLQQTQVAAVEPYFKRFLRALPTIDALAQASEQQVLRLWEGLGYYRRARQLHRAARMLVEQHEGRFPRDPQVVRGLPGIGRYTAGAILSMAFDDRLPILEANTVRLFSRLLAYRGDPRCAEGQRLLWSMAETVLPRRNVGTFNQALMELGSEVCLSQTPRCDACPAAPLCRANLQGLQTEVPLRPARPTIESVREAAVVTRRRGRILLLRRPDGQRWAGLWDFPRFPVHAEQRSALHRELIENVRRLAGVIVKPGKHLKTIKHGVTRYRITLDCYEAEHIRDAQRKGRTNETKWLRPAELNDYPLSTTGRQLANLIS